MLSRVQCFAPHEMCVTVLAEYHFWRKSIGGVACHAELYAAKAAATGDANEAAAVAAAGPRFQAFCDGQCGTTWADFVLRFRAEGCAAWPAAV